MRRQLVTAATVLALLTVLTGLAYPLAVLGVAQAAFAHRANGSLVSGADGRVVGSELLGQQFTGVSFFQPRPSAANYDGLASSASNLGPTNPALLDAVHQRVDAYRSLNGLAADAAVPVDAVTASASGLDPHISVANARLQAPRVARARALDVDRVQALVDRHTDGRPLGVLGEAGVDVLALNLALLRGEA
jgi:K+-transporting ATPase ATPase C chain